MVQIFFNKIKYQMIAKNTGERVGNGRMAILILQTKFLNKWSNLVWYEIWMYSLETRQNVYMTIVICKSEVADFHDLKFQTHPKWKLLKFKAIPWNTLCSDTFPLLFWLWYFDINVEENIYIAQDIDSTERALLMLITNADDNLRVSSVDTWIVDLRFQWMAFLYFCGSLDHRACIIAAFEKLIQKM